MLRDLRSCSATAVPCLVTYGMPRPTLERYRTRVKQDSLRPWGHYEVLSEDQLFKIKTITVLPGRRLSYQRHVQRSEHWLVVKGSGVATLDGAAIHVLPGTAVDVPAGAAHRMENNGNEDLVFVEVQRGDYFGEDDIVRLEDDYGRMS